MNTSEETTVNDMGKKINMKPQYAAVVLFLLFMASSLASIGSFQSTSRMVNEDMDRALALTMAEQQSNVISQDTIQKFNHHLQIAELRGKATLAVDAHGRQFKAYAHCSKATIFSMSDQRPAAILWMLTAIWAMCFWHLRRQPEALGEPVGLATSGNDYGGLIHSDTDGRFYTTNGDEVRLTPMQHQLMEMFFLSPTHTLSKAEICDALWPKKPDASDTLYTLIKRLKPIVEQHSGLKVESDRSKAYRLTIKNITN